MDKADISLRLSEVLCAVGTRRETMIGFPLNLTPLPMFAWLEPFLRDGLTLNNLGSPWTGGTYGLNTFEQEREVVRWFGSLWHLPEEETAGNVTNCGSEGNFQGLAAGRDRFDSPALYASEATHYSVFKAARWLRMPIVEIAVDDQHRLDLDAFRANLHPDRPAVVCLNAGTTMAGAVDDIPGALTVLADAGVEHYVHVDAALSGLILPFWSGAPLFDFYLPGVDSMSASGHKMPGCPIPCGVFVCRKGETGESVEYLGSHDSTVCGSRDGWSVLALWLAVQHYGREGFARMVQQCRRTATMAMDLLTVARWPAWQAPFSTTVMLDKPPMEVCRKWQLATSDGEAHVVIMPHVSTAMLSAFVRDLTMSHFATNTIERGEPCLVLQ